MTIYAILEPINGPARAAYAAIRSRTDRYSGAVGSSLSPEVFARAGFRLVGELHLTADDLDGAGVPIQPGYLALAYETGRLHAPGESLPGPHLYDLLGFPGIADLNGQDGHGLYMIPTDLTTARDLLATVVPRTVTDGILIAEGSALPVWLTVSSLSRIALAALTDPRPVALRDVFVEITPFATMAAET